jgi:general secretion pathway protein G
MGQIRRRGVRGFTLIEVLIVMVIIAILAGVGLYMYNNSITAAREATLKNNLFGMREAIDRYYADKNKWPASLDTLVSEKYIRQVPNDPTTGAPDWQTTVGEPDPSNPAAEPGISDVHSSSSQTSPLNNTPYAEW